MIKAMSFWNQATWVGVLTLSHTSCCGALGKLLNLSGLQVYSLRAPGLPGGSGAEGGGCWHAEGPHCLAEPALRHVPGLALSTLASMRLS